MRALVLVLVCTFGASACTPRKPPPRPNLDQADYLRKKGDINGAIAAYRRYIDERLEARDRAPNEDPIFYLVVVGDLLLDTRRAGDAYVTYKEAEKKGADKALIADRYVKVAQWYIWAGEHTEAMRILKDHSYLDPLLFEGYLDQAERGRLK
jgi:hypothetical protein